MSETRTATATAITLRRASFDDVPLLERLIDESVRELCRADYGEAQIEAALGTAFGVDSELISDGTYFVVEADGQLIGCGGWSRRRKLFGAGQGTGIPSELLDPTVDSARVRAFFVRPDWARRGIGRALIERCEAEALAQGFGTAELMATLSGHRLYRAMGYVGDERVQHRLPGEVGIEFIPMRKQLR